MSFPVLLISEIVGVIAVVLILSISPVVKNKRPLQFLYPKREGSAALTVGILVLLFTAFVQRFQPLLFTQLINFTSYPGFFNAPKLSFGNINVLTAEIIFSAAIIFPVGISLVLRKQPLLSIGLSKPNLKIGLQTGLVLVILVIFLQGKIFAIINGLGQGAFLTLAIAFVAVLGEEIVFRGYIQPRFTAWLGEKWGIVAAILLYVAWWALPVIGSYSGDGLQLLGGFLYRITLACLLSWIMKKTGSLVSPVLYHIVHLWLAFI
jgi:membrane protease YdiL (CAAX protease family)